MGRAMAILDNADSSSTISRELVNMLNLKPDVRPVQVELESEFVQPDKITLQLFFFGLHFPQGFFLVLFGLALAV